MNKAASEILLEEVSKCFCFDLRSVVDQSEWRVCAVLKLDVVIELRVEIGQFVSLGLAEDVEVIMVFRGNLRVK